MGFFDFFKADKDLDELEAADLDATDVDTTDVEAADIDVDAIVDAARSEEEEAKKKIDGKKGRKKPRGGKKNKKNKQKKAEPYDVTLDDLAHKRKKIVNKTAMLGVFAGFLVLAVLAAFILFTRGPQREGERPEETLKQKPLVFGKGDLWKVRTNNRINQIAREVHTIKEQVSEEMASSKEEMRNMLDEFARSLGVRMEPFW